MFTFVLQQVPSVSSVPPIDLYPLGGRELVRVFGAHPERLAFLLREGIVFRDEHFPRERYAPFVRVWAQRPLERSVFERLLDFIPQSVFAEVHCAHDAGELARMIAQRLLDDVRTDGIFLDGRELLLKVLLICARDRGLLSS